MKELSDIELLDAYAGQRSEEAFRELVTRHVDLIYSAAMRQLRDPHLAQEATQTAFIALAGKAGRLSRRTIIAGWLHRAAHFAALNIQRSEARRKHWEEEAATMNPPGETEQAFQEHALPHVDGALAELAERDRDAVILRFLQQKSLRDVARAIGTSEEAAKKRVSRALDKLRGVLARRDVAIPAAVLAAGLSQMPVTAAPTGLPSALAALAVNTAVVPVLTTTASLLTLLASLRTKLAVIAGLLVLGGAVFLLLNRNVTTPATPPMTTTNAVKAPSMKIKLASVMVDDQAKALRFYTQVLGFVVKQDQAIGQERWLTVGSGSDDTQLLLEPMGFAPAKVFQKALFDAGVPMTAFAVEDIQAAYQRMRGLGAVFRMAPRKAGPTTIAMLEDTCGNRLQLFETPPAGNRAATSTPMIKLVSVMVPDQDKALEFYTKVLGFVKKEDVPAGGARWLTVVSPDEPDGTELVLEPAGFEFARTYQKALFDAGLPWTTLASPDVEKEHARLTRLGVVFRMKPRKKGPTSVAVFDDTCGNLVQIFQN